MGKGSGTCDRPQISTEAGSSVQNENEVNGQGSLWTVKYPDEDRPAWLSEDKLQKALGQVESYRRPRGRAGGTRTRYSPTELEAYMRCPRGWFLQRIMKAEAPYRERTVKGRTAHSLIETADRDGIEAARAQWKQSQDDENTMEIVERAWKKYCSDWTHGGVRHQEVTMTLTLDSGHQIKGRADRVDEREDGVLVIDWKLRSKVNPTDSEFRQSQLQRYLYPQMAAETYKKPALGMLYVSLQHNRHEGSTVGDLGLGDSVNPHWKEESEVALKRVETAIGEIEEGHWWRKGESCPEWCSCKLEEQIKSS